MATRLRLQNFRCHRDKSVTIPDETTIITGRNGSGKTSLIEAIYVAYRGKSWRSNSESILRHDDDDTSSWWRIDLADDTLDDNRTIKFQLNERGKASEFMVNNRVTKRLPLGSRRPVIFFEPGDMALLYGSPDRRRKFLDRFIAQQQIGYSSLLSRFERVARQRGQLIRDGNYMMDEKMIWDLQFARLSTEISMARRELITAVNYDLATKYHEIAGGAEKVGIRFMAGTPADFDDALARLVAQDGIITPVGANRDDFKFIFGGKDAKVTASRGENRSLLFAMLGVITDLMRTKYGEDRVTVLLDDIDSELDSEHRRNLYNMSSFRRHTIATTLEYSGSINEIHLSAPI